jgi:hypothetical protein
MYRFPYIKTKTGLTNQKSAPDFGCVDGALLVDPLNDFPFDDTFKAWHWVQHQKNPAKLRIIPFDVKANLTHRSPWQKALFFIVVSPEDPDYLCIMPMQSFTTLYAIYQRLRDATFGVHTFHEEWDAYVSYSAILAPFAVHKNVLPTALESLVHCMERGTPYMNPSNGVRFTCWQLFCDDGAQDLLRSKSKRHRTSANAVQSLYTFLEENLQGKFSLRLNRVQPLICDFILLDEENGDYFFIEHKSLLDGNSILKQYGDPKYNWHFLFAQVMDDVFIYKRGAPIVAATKGIELKHIDLQARDSGKTFAKIIRSDASTVKADIRAKWKDFTHYDDGIDSGLLEDTKETDESESPDASGLQQRRLHERGKAQRHVIRFANNFNEQCWKLGKLVCLVLIGNPCGDAIIVRHTWTSEEKELFDASR